MKSILFGALSACLLAGIPVWASEDCIDFNPATVQASLVNGTWKIVDGSMWMLDFGTGATGQANASKAKNVIQHYGFDQQCFVGRPNAPMMYFKIAGGRFPQGSFPGQDAIPVNPYAVSAQEVGGRWKVLDCSSYLLDFGTGAASQANATAAANLIRDNHLREQCFVGRPNAPMMYFLQDTAYRPYASLGVTLRPQQTDNWCWAASGQMTMEFLGKFVTQCTEANNRFGRTDCCDGSSCPMPNCDSGGWPEYPKYGFSASTTSSAALSWDELWNQINCRQDPVAFSWAWTGGGGHMMVVRGLQIQADGTKMVQINDPWSPCVGNTRWISYDAYVQQAGSYTHWNDYYNITKN